MRSGYGGRFMTEGPTGRQIWIILAVVLFSLVVLGTCSVVFLVLTGIIAEPETVIESILRTLTGQ
jgi:hypothetical protein